MLSEFAGTDRFRVVSRLGSGGMGVVYHVADRDHGTRFALKSVGAVHGEALLRFKREFRAAQDLNHPNLVKLGELFEERGQWFYTMELVEGTTLLRYVRPHLGAHAPAVADVETAVPAPGRDASEVDTDTETPPPSLPPVDASGATRSPGFDEVRLRRSMAQLADGLSALHRAGKVHRDIKPSNVLVTWDGRVVILDFGLIVESRRGMQESDVGVMGTYPYMSPEQLSSIPVDARTDWYSVGVILFQALTGRFPFQGTTVRDMGEKLRNEAPAPSDVAPGVPRDLDELCRLLLRRNRDDRPSEQEIRDRLHVSEYVGRTAVHPDVLASTGGTFVGRKAEIGALRGAFDRTLDRRAVNVLVTGEAGIGKSELVERFLTDLEAAHPGVVILRGRCFERESVPYKSFDGVVDALSSYLARQGEAGLRRLVPNTGPLLARAFPVLRRIEAFASNAVPEVLDLQERRARIFAAMRSLLHRLATIEAVVVVIEDLQWLDEDSRSLLGEVMREPGAPTLLFVGTKRSALAAQPAGPAASPVDGVAFEEIRVERLGDEDARVLAEERLMALGMTDAGRAAEIAAEAQGHPLFIDELARHVRVNRDAPLRVGLGDAVLSRVDLLAPEDRRILEALAATRGPVAEAVLATACELSVRDLHARIQPLRADRWVRVSAADRADTLEIYHGRLAQAVLERTSEEARRAIHARLAHALEANGSTDFVQLAEHFRHAGEPAKAARFACLGAESAAEALAFERAAQLYRLSLELAPEDERGLEDRRERLAHALANAGRGLDAAKAYLSAVDGRPAAQAVDLRRRAAEQFLLSGRMKRGMATFALVLSTLRVWYPRTFVGVLLAITVVQIRLWLRRGRFTERDESMVDPERRLRADACLSAALGLTPIDPIRGYDFYGRALLHALEIGEPGRVAINMAMDASRIISVGPKSRHRAYRMLFVARRIAERSRVPRARAVVSYSEGMAAYLMGEWREATQSFSAADTIFREECTDAPELRTLQACITHCQWEAGDWTALRSRASRAVKEAMERGDLFTEATIRAGLSIEIALMSDEAERGLAMATQTMDGWSGLGFDVQRYMYWLHGSMAQLYLGDREGAVARFEEGWARAKRSLLFQVQLMRAGAAQVGGIVAATRAIDGGPDRARLLRAAKKHARSLIAEDATWCRAAGEMLFATTAALDGDEERAQASFDVALRELEAGGMLGRRAAVQWAKGAHLGGEKGEALVRGAKQFFEEHGIARPAAFAATMAPLLHARDLLRIPPDFQER